MEGFGNLPELTHLSLFSGIGGLDLAAEMAGFRTVGQCEWADFPRSVLEKQWPDVPRWRDVHELTADEFFKRTGSRTVTCISGGFPCQPHSVAGKRKASGDERDLWPEMRRIIGEIKPRWVVAENVRGLLSSEYGRFFLGVLRDFAELGYDVGWGVTSAAAVGAIHRRERVAIVAHSHIDGLQGRKEFCTERRNGEQLFPGFLQDSPGHDISELQSYGNDNGVPDRVDRLKCLGNAVVPQQFYPVFKAIAEVEAQVNEILPI